jgi:phage/plasmid primase-like uncharacterized protein
MPKPTRRDLHLLAQNYQTAVNPIRLDRFAHSMGLSAASLRRLGIGWAFESGAWAFPMCDAQGNVIGIRLRFQTGKKRAVTGGREGLFIPSDLTDGDMVLIAEGPTDTAALLDLGFSAVGRPSCNGGRKLLVQLVQERRPSSVVIVSDNDSPGQRGAMALASALRRHCGVRVIRPPAGIKDARAWKRSGATAADIQAAIDATPRYREQIVMMPLKPHRRGNAA